MAKDTEKLIRELSLISFLMAERRPVSALEIKRDVEGYSEMNDDAFARRFYADRAELESLGIKLSVEKPSEGYFEAELYSLPPQNFHLPAIEFSDGELAALQTALTLLDGSFAYSAPLRLALQQLTWGRPSPLNTPTQRSVAVALEGQLEGRDISQRLAKIETAISRRKRIEFSYYTIERDSEEERLVNPYHLLYKGGQFYLVGFSHERDDIRVFRLSRIRGKASYATKAEHDFQAPDDFDPRKFASRLDWQLGEIKDEAAIWVSDRIAWLIKRDFGRYGTIRKAEAGDRAPGAGVIFQTEFASSRLLISWALGLQANARILAPTGLVEEAESRLKLLVERHSSKPRLARVVSRAVQDTPRHTGNGHYDSPIKPERFARLVTLATILIDAARRELELEVGELCNRLQLTRQELSDDIDVLNVVNFGGGSYVLYAEIQADLVTVDPEPYGDNFAQPARLQPLEAKALVAAIDLLGDHLPQGSLASARQKIVRALGEDPARKSLRIASNGAEDTTVVRTVNRAVVGHRMLEIVYYKPNEDEYTTRKVEPYTLMNAHGHWYVVCFDPSRDDVRHFRLDRIKQAKLMKKVFEPREEMDTTADLEGWPRTGQLPCSRTARVWISPERARWAQEARTVVEKLADGSVIVELPFAGSEWLVREILKEAGDAMVLEPEDARGAVLDEARSALPKRRGKTKVAA